MRTFFAAVALSLLGLHASFLAHLPLSHMPLPLRPLSLPSSSRAPLRVVAGEGFDAPDEAVRLSEIEAGALDEVDYVVIGSGIGGLSCAAMLRWYGYSVVVLESHYLPGGVAHTFERGGFKFDAGPSLWNGMSTKPYNPLREVLELVGQGDSIQYAKYDGWVMHIPEGSFKFKVGKGNFEPIIERFGGPKALDEWEKLQTVLKPIQALATAIPPLILRSDAGVVRTMLPHMLKLLRGGPIANKVQGSFYDVTKNVIKSEFLKNWFEFLSFALSGLPADGTIAAAVAYTMRDLHQEGAALDYPIGGSAAVVEALVRGIEQGPPPTFPSSTSSFPTPSSSSSSSTPNPTPPPTGAFC